MALTHDVLIVGGGVIGLSIAWELSRRGRQVCLLEQGALGQEASWAGAGMLPAVPDNSSDPLEQMTALSRQLHQQWARELLAETGIDTGHRVCGALYVARTTGESAALRAWQRSCLSEGMKAEWLDPEGIAQCEPSLTRRLLGGCRLPDEAQLRNPHHLRALAEACRRRGVSLRTHCKVQQLDAETGMVVTAGEQMRPRQLCVAAGPWTRQLVSGSAWSCDIFPVRGQMVLFCPPHRCITHTINDGPRYLVSRSDNRLLAGSTEEEVGFDKSTTAEAVEELARFARELIPSLNDAPIEKTWAGLRPASFDGFPYLGRAPGSQNVFVASGHFRNGLTISTATAVLLAQLMCDEETSFDLERFRVGR